jgi:7-cyano-7-deazaguanine synthase
LQDSRQTLSGDRTLDRMSESIPIAYVPDRNTIFLSFGLAWPKLSTPIAFALASTL